MDLTWLKGRSCTGIARRENVWKFTFGEGCSITVECPWRIMANGRIAVAHADHNQRFGLPKPINAITRSLEILSGHAIREVNVQPESADLCLQLDEDIRIELFTDSSGYESWQISRADGKVWVGRNA